MMGSGFYSSSRSMSRSMDYEGKTREEIFSHKSLNNAMNPYGIKVRESRDSVEHPESLAIVLGLDVTGSMGSIPHHLVKEGLTSIMDKIVSIPIKDPQILFLGIGDHECDNSPLQVSQFESSDELLDKWLTSIYLEGGGGGNWGESYSLAWYFAAFHTSIDCFEKRNQKGYLFTIGDEPVLKTVPRSFMRHLMGDGQYEDYDSDFLLNEARKKYNVFHVHVKETSSGSRQEVIDGWKQLLQDDLIIAEKGKDVPLLIAEKISKKEEKTCLKTMIEEDIK